MSETETINLDYREIALERCEITTKADIKVRTDRMEQHRLDRAAGVRVKPDVKKIAARISALGGDSERAFVMANRLVQPETESIVERAFSQAHFANPEALYESRSMDAVNGISIPIFDAREIVPGRRTR